MPRRSMLIVACVLADTDDSNTSEGVSRVAGERQKDQWEEYQKARDTMRDTVRDTGCIHYPYGDPTCRLVGHSL